MTEKSSLGWVFAVRGINEPAPRFYATVADDAGHAEALIGDYLAITSERIKFHRLLTDGEVMQLGIGMGDVKLLP
jgi:hypothetical protein